MIIIVNLEKANSGENFIGCIAALETLKGFYGDILFSAKEMSDVCMTRSLAG